jgi:hypothetical protein
MQIPLTGVIRCFVSGLRQNSIFFAAFAPFA